MEVAKEKIKVVFVCVENARRSQMAQAFAEKISRGRLEVYNAGSRPASQIDTAIIEVMKEKGIDLSGNRTNELNDLPSVEMDYLVTMGCEETCPAVSAKKDYRVADPRSEGKAH